MMNSWATGHIYNKCKLAILYHTHLKTFGCPSKEAKFYYCKVILSQLDPRNLTFIQCVHGLGKRLNCVRLSLISASMYFMVGTTRLS